jgi:hypothetical protein
MRLAPAASPYGRDRAITRADQTCPALFLHLRLASQAIALLDFWSTRECKHPRAPPRHKRAANEVWTNMGNLAHQPKTDVVVTVVRVVVVAIRRARVVGIVVPRTATHHASGPPDRFFPARQA